MNESTHTHHPAAHEALSTADALTRRTFPWRTVLAVGIVIVGMFLIGYLPTSFHAAITARERDAAVAELRLARVQLSLASAAIDARRGEYEQARVAAVAFFTTLSDELAGGGESTLMPAQREAMRPLLNERDEIITLLARGDPASAERLAALYTACRQSAAP